MKSSSAGGRGSSRAERGSARKRTVANATASDGADEALASVSSGAVHAADLPVSVIAELWRAQIPPENVAAVLSTFGRIPEDAQYDFAVGIINLSGSYHLRKTIEKQQFPLPHEQRKRLEDIGTSARRVLKLLGVNKAELIAGGVGVGSTLHPTVTTCLLTGLYRVGVERRPEKATIGAQERLTILLVLLSDLVETTERCARETSTRPGHGGNRRVGELTAEGELIQAVMQLYLKFRDRFSNSGPQPAFDEPLRKFVRSCLELVDPGLATRITDAAIRGAFVRWRAQIKRKS
jgi:hypothetical protein